MKTLRKKDNQAQDNPEGKRLLGLVEFPALNREQERQKAMMIPVQKEMNQSLAGVLCQGLLSKTPR